VNFKFGLSHVTKRKMGGGTIKIKNPRIYIMLGFLCPLCVFIGVLFKNGIFDVLGVVLAIPLVILSINAFEDKRRQN
jgi:predicted PurR-regulated permease PerM